MSVGARPLSDPPAMSRFYDPRRCPDCRAPLVGQEETCGNCGLPLRGQDAERLAVALQAADGWLARLRATEPGSDPLVPYPAGAGPAVPSGGVRTPRPTSYLLARLSGASVAAILLGLGAVCILVAATVFVAVTWGDLSVGARTALLLGVTAAFAFAAVVVTRRGLRGSAEALWLVVAGMFALDLAGARWAGLFGADTRSLASWLTVSGLLLMLPFAGVGWWAQRTPTHLLVAAQVVSAIGLVVAGVGRAVDWPYDLAWFAALAVPLLAGLALTVARLRLQVLAAAVVNLVVLGWAVLSVLAVDSATDRPALSQLVLHGSGAQLLVASAYAAVVAAVRAVPRLGRVVVAAIALGGVGLLVWLPSWAEGRTWAALGMAVVLALLVATSVAVRGDLVWAPAAVAVALLAAAAVAVPVAALLQATV